MPSMSIQEMFKQRNRFRRAPNATRLEELPLRAKQALVEKILRGQPIKELVVYEENGQYMVTEGWAQLQAIFDYMDGKFPTWTAEEKRQWERNQA